MIPVSIAAFLSISWSSLQRLRMPNGLGQCNNIVLVIRPEKKQKQATYELALRHYGLLLDI